MLFTQRFIEMACSYPSASAILSISSRVSYEELHQRAKCLAEAIDSTSSELMIGVLMEKSVDYIVSILGVHLLGRTVVPLDSGYPVERLRQMISSINLSLCLTNQNYDVELSEMLLGEQIRLIRVDNFASSLADTRHVEIRSGTLDEVAAYVVFTSGTTGRPKPVMVPYRSLSTLIDWMVKSSRPSGTTVLYAAQGFDVSFQEIYSALCCGDGLLIITDKQKKDLHVLRELISSQKITRLFLPTSMLSPFATFCLHEASLPNLRQVIVAGEQLKITPAVRQWFETHPHCQLINQYGPSETHVVMEYRLDNDPQNWPDLPPIGQVIPGSTAYLLDDQLQPVALGKPGQLYVAGRSLALGYCGMPSQTAEKFVTYLQTQERMYNTGDICVLNKQALYEYKGRRDRQYKVRGYRVELKEIETAAMGCGLLDDCLVVARQSDLSTSLILYFTAQQRDQDISLSLHSYLAERLPEYMLPSFYKKIAAIPLTQNGKTDIEKLPQVGAMRSELSSSYYVDPRDELESMVCTLAACCFGLDRIGVNDNFMEAGANSINLISLLAELRYVLAHDFRQTDLFEHPTPRRLCDSYRCSQNAAPSNAPAMSVSNRKLRLAAIHDAQGRKRG